MKIIAIVSTIFAVSFMISYIKLSKRLMIVNQAFAELYITYASLREIIDNKNNNEDLDIHKENFIKFLSDSREWAYTYIEEVQAGLEKFIKEVEPEIEFYDSYGLVLEGMIAPHDKALKKISQEFKELKNLLPKDQND